MITLVTTLVGFLMGFFIFDLTDRCFFWPTWLRVVVTMIVSMVVVTALALGLALNGAAK